MPGADASRSRSYDERHADGLEVLRRFQGGAGDVEAAAASFPRRLGALGSFAVDHVMADLWARPQLSRRDRSMVVIALLAATGSVDELSSHTEIGLRHGLTREEVDEVVLQVAAYVGYPRAMAAARVVEAAFCRIDGVDRQPPRPPAAPKGDDERRADAADVLGTLTGGRSPADPAAALGGIVAELGDVGLLAFDWAFGEVWSRPQLSRRDRSLVVVALLAWLGSERELDFHVRGALHHGATREEVTEVVVQLCVYGGFPRAVAGMRAVRATFDRLDQATGPPGGPA